VGSRAIPRHASPKKKLFLLELELLAEDLPGANDATRAAAAVNASTQAGTSPHDTAKGSTTSMGMIVRPLYKCQDPQHHSGDDRPYVRIIDDDPRVRLFRHKVVCRYCYSGVQPEGRREGRVPIAASRARGRKGGSNEEFSPGALRNAQER